MASVCGKTVVECGRHAEARLGQGNTGQGKYRYAIGAYSKVPVSQGFTRHGVAPPQGRFFTDEQLQAFKRSEKAEMAQLVQGMNDDFTDQDEMEELARDLRVKFAEPLHDKEEPRTKKAMSNVKTTDGLRKALAADGFIARKKKSATPELWFGVIHIKKGDRWVTLNPTEANAATSKGCRIDRLFHAQTEAEAWLEEDEEQDEEGENPRKAARQAHTIYESDESSEMGSEGNKRGNRREERRRTKKQAQKVLRKRLANKEREKSKSSRSASTKKGRETRSGHSSTRKHKGHRSEASSDTSSSSSSSSESGSSEASSKDSEDKSEDSSPSEDSSTKSGRRSSRSRKTNKKSSKTKSRKPKPKSDNFHKYQNDDPSTGDPQRVYGMSINGTKIDKEVAPDQMRRSDQATMYTAAVDVTSLPGGWNSNRGVSEEMFNESQKIVQLTSSILASSGKARGMEIQDTSWNSTIRQSLGKVNNREDVFEFVKKLGKSKKAAFRQEGNLIQHFLYQRQYSGTYIREYARSSLLNRITDRSFTYFFSLGDAIRQLAYNHPNWEGGPAKAMLAFHSEKLLEIRQFAVSRKQLILQVYSYLRDSHAKEFYHESMSGALWERIGDLSMAPPSSGGGTGGSGTSSGEATRCSWCNSRDLHKLLNLPGQKNICPLKTLTEKSKAREGAKWVVEQKRATPAKDVQELLSEALTRFVV
jgi:hypothetical protein